MTAAAPDPEPKRGPESEDGDFRVFLKIGLALVIAMTLSGVAAVFLGKRATTSEVTYVKFLQMVEKGEVDTERPISIVAVAGRPDGDFVEGFRTHSAGKVTAPVDLAADRNIKNVLEKKAGIVVQTRSDVSGNAMSGVIPGLLVPAGVFVILAAVGIFLFKVIARRIG